MRAPHAKPRFMMGFFGAAAALCALASLLVLRPEHDRGGGGPTSAPRVADVETPPAPVRAQPTTSVVAAPAVVRTPISTSRSANELRGTVRDALGRPVANAVVQRHVLATRAEVGAAEDDFDALAVSDDRGDFVATVTPGDYAIFAAAGDRASALLGPISVVPGEDVAALELILDAPARLSGIVVGADGRPTRAEITLVRAPLGGRRTGIITKRDGRFAIAPIPGVPFELEARDRDTGAAATVHLDRAQENVVVRLGAPPGALDVHVTDETGAPVDGALVTVEHVDGSGGLLASAGPDGHAHLSPSAARVRVSAQTDDAASEPIELVLDERPRALTVRVERRGSIRGRILTASGAPASGAAALVALDHANDTSQVDLDASGAFRFSPLSPGRYEVRYEGDALLGDVMTQAVTLVGREDRVLPDLRPRGGRIVRGVVVDESGDPVADADVAVIDGRAESLAHGVTTDAEGRFTLPGEVFGTVRVRAEGVGVVTAITLVGEREESVSLVARGIGHVSGILRGRLTADARVRCADGLWHPVDERGQYALSCTPGSTIEVEASGARRSFPVEVEEEEQTYVELRL